MRSLVISIFCLAVSSLALGMDGELEQAKRAVTEDPGDAARVQRCAVLMMRRGEVFHAEHALISDPRLVPEGGMFRAITGAIFTRVGAAELKALGVNPEVMGESWMDPDGMIWGDVVRNENGSVRMMTHFEAEAYAVGLQLPSESDFVRLLEYMGGHSMTFSPNYRPQVLPHLAVSERDYWFWASSVAPHDETLASIFNGRTAAIRSSIRNGRDPVRFVVRRR